MASEVGWGGVSREESVSGRRVEQSLCQTLRRVQIRLSSKGYSAKVLDGKERWEIKFN